MEVVLGAGSYVAGEETSLLRSLAGLRATVRAKPLYPATHGYLGRPTAVNNVETLATFPAVVAGGGAAYARLGRAPETGTILVCLNERFARPGAYEGGAGHHDPRHRGGASCLVSRLASRWTSAAAFATREGSWHYRSAASVFLAFHYPDTATNLLTSGHGDAVTSCPEYKVTAVSLRR